MCKTAINLYVWANHTNSTQTVSESPFDPIKHSSLLIPSANHIICCDHVDRQLVQEYQKLPIEKSIFTCIKRRCIISLFFPRGKLLFWTNINVLISGVL